MISVEPRTTIVQCGRDRLGPRIFSRGGNGECDFWEREPGIDDDDWDPAGLPRIAPYVPEPPPAPRAQPRSRRLVDGATSTEARAGTSRAHVDHADPRPVRWDLHRRGVSGRDGQQQHAELDGAMLLQR